MISISQIKKFFNNYFKYIPPPARSAEKRELFRGFRGRNPLIRSTETVERTRPGAAGGTGPGNYFLKNEVFLPILRPKGGKMRAAYFCAQKKEPRRAMSLS